jgi:ribonucleoside-diphosphate reductase alpha chain
MKQRSHKILRILELQMNSLGREESIGSIMLDIKAKAERNVVIKDSPVKPPTATRHKLPKDRRSVTVTFSLFYKDSQEEEQFYLIVGLYPDGSPGELFINSSKSGSVTKSLLDTWAITMSIALQHGVPLKVLCDKLSFIGFEPSGNTGKEFGYASSAVDYIVRWMAKRFLQYDYREVKI